MKKVLLTSASQSFLNRNSNLLTDKGFQFFTSSAGVEALRLHDEHFFDLIISDFELDDMDGCQFCSEVRNSEQQQLVPVVIICRDNAEHIEKVKRSDASAILFRPLDPTHLLITIGSFIDMQLARNTRVEFSAQVSCQQLATKFVCNSHDISISGILLEADSQLDMASSLTCLFTLPGSGQIQTEAEIVRFYTQSDGRQSFYGVKFINLPLTGSDAIKKYIVANAHLGIKQKAHKSIGRSLDS